MKVLVQVQVGGRLAAYGSGRSARPTGEIVTDTSTIHAVVWSRRFPFTDGTVRELLASTYGWAKLCKTLRAEKRRNDNCSSTFGSREG